MVQDVQKSRGLPPREAKRAASDPIVSAFEPRARASSAPGVHALQNRFGNEQISMALRSPSGGLSALIHRDLSAAVADPARTLAQLPHGGGCPLPGEVRQRMEEAFDHDFSHVRVHTGGRVAKAAAELQAHAFALGADLFFGSQEFAPGTPRGDRLLAHELTHVVQADEGRIPTHPDQQVSSPSDPLEQEAYANEDRILSKLAAAEGAVADAPLGLEGAEGVEVGGDSSTTPDSELQGSERASSAKVERGGVVARRAEPEEEVDYSDTFLHIEALSDRCTEPKNSLSDTRVAEGVELREPGTGGPAWEPVDLPSPDPVASPKAVCVPLGGAPSGAGSLDRSAVRPPDELVDHKMALSWDSSEYDAAVAKYRPSLPGARYLIDPELIERAPPGVRTALSLLDPVASGQADLLWVEGVKAIPAVGVLGHVVYGVRDLVRSAAEVPQVEGPWDDLCRVIEVLRGILDIVSGVLSNLSDVVTVGQYLMAAGGAGVGGVGGGAAGTVPAPGAGTAAGAAAGAGVGGVAGAAPGAIIGAILSKFSANCDLAKATLDVGLTVAYLLQGRAAERAGLARSGEAFRDLAKDRAYRGLSGYLDAAITAGNMALANIALANAKKSFATFAIEMAPSLVPPAQALLDVPAVQDLSTLSPFPIHETLSGILDSYFFEGMMHKDGPATSLRQLSGVGRAGGLLEGARAQTIAELEAAWDALEGAPPAWHQALINQLLDPQDPTTLEMIEMMLVPSGVYELAMREVRGIPDWLHDAWIDGRSSAIQSAALFLEQDVTSSVEWLNDRIDEYGPFVKEWLDTHGEALQAQRIQLSALREHVAPFEELMARLESSERIPDTIRSSANAILAQIERLRLTPDDLDLPIPGLSRLAEAALAPFNQMLDGARAQIETIRDQMCHAYELQHRAAMGWVRRQLNELKAAIAEGGPVEVLLQQAYDSLAAQVAAFMQMAAEWTHARIEIDFKGLAQLIRRVECELNSMKSDDRLAAFLHHVSTHGVQSMRSWKEEHEENVERCYFPKVPDHEVDAAEHAFSLISDTLDERMKSGDWSRSLAGQRRRSDRAMSMAQSQRGKQGVPAIESLSWAMATLADVAKRVDA
ncbi:MAG: DUF4157 domain-containing protein [Deltaproteobacteria bacterium]|nr:MAG: DUF4157 domain-containing protein [Deltaproteobacteria bacterium]